MASSPIDLLTRRVDALEKATQTQDDRIKILEAGVAQLHSRVDALERRAPSHNPRQLLDLVVEVMQELMPTSVPSFGAMPEDVQKRLLRKAERILNAQAV